MALAALLCVCAEAANLPKLPTSPDLYVSGFFSASIHRYRGPRNALTGPYPAPQQAMAVYARNVVRRPWGIAFGPDGNLYVANSAGTTSAIVRVDGPFSNTPGATASFVESGAFFDLAFGPDGNVYAAGHGPVRRFDIATGASMDDFTHGYVLDETRGLAFGADGFLYVSNYVGCVSGPSGCIGTRGEIVRFDALSGDFVDVYVRDGEAGLRAPWKIAFGMSGQLFVANWTPDGNTILRFQTSAHSVRRTGRRNGAVFIERRNWSPLYLAIGPDGNLYVSDSDSSGSAGAVLSFDGKTGAFVETFIPAVEGGPRGIAFAPGRR
jgi:DNA-binding beta-propeller fold protein YncE